jgi:hypothetical protein
VIAHTRSHRCLAVVSVLAVLWAAPFVGAFAFGSDVAAVALVATLACVTYASMRHGVPGAFSP